MSDLRIEQWSVERLRPYERNPRKNDHVVNRMVESLREFGFRVPVLARSDGELIDGHLRYKAALAMGMGTVPVIPADDMSEAQIRAFRILVNRSATWADWDEELLLQELRALQLADMDLAVTGFDQRELDQMLMDMGTDGKDPDAAPEPPAVPVVRDGEIWTLGRHRVMCGDSRSMADARRLLSDAQLDMIWTDPPYNVDYQGKAGKIRNDKMSPADFDEFLTTVHRVMHESLRPGGGIYVAHSEAGDGTAFRRTFTSTGFKLAACLIWRKQTAVLGRGDYHFQHEPVLYGWRRGAAHRWYGNRKQRTLFETELPGLREMEDGTWQFCLENRLYRLSGEALRVEELPTTVIDVPKPARSDLHPTMKPVALIEPMVANSSPRGGLVGDFFGGSGSTLMACERLGRSARLMEADPKFAEVIIRRWQDYSGGQAVRESDGVTFAELTGEGAM
ncbi:MAG: DNA modification methylase [Desulfovibrio fairfieldensis]